MMKKAGYRPIVNVYLTFFVLLVVVSVSCFAVLYSLLTVQVPNLGNEKSSWAKTYTASFSENIYFEEKLPYVNQKGIDELNKYGSWVQILDEKGNRVYSHNAPEMPIRYTIPDLLAILSDESTVYYGHLQDNGQTYSYILKYPVNITKVTMYVNGVIFNGGKDIVLILLALIIVSIIIFGLVYGYRLTKTISKITNSLTAISNRSYLPIESQGSYQAIFDSLNVLDMDIRKSDEIQKQTDFMREQWLSAITHDLKTPLSPIKGYAELLADSSEEQRSSDKVKGYSKVIIKNIDYAERLIDDLTLTYQLDSGMIPMNKTSTNLVRFLKEVIIECLNTPEYENCSIHFHPCQADIVYRFDDVLLKRAFNNLILNSFVHGNKQTKIDVSLSIVKERIKIKVADNGPGIKRDELPLLFNRYFRGENSRSKPEGTGLGLAIVKQIIELHDGEIEVTSPGAGTTFAIYFSI